MGWWKVNADTLAGSRFLISPLAETTAALFTLSRGTAGHPGEQAWLDEHLPAYRALLAAEPITALLLRAARRPTWNADFLTPTPVGASFEEELEMIRRIPPDQVISDLEVTLEDPVPPPLAGRTDLAGRFADLVEWVWRRAVAPEWERRRRIVEADIVARTERLGLDGWAAALEGLRSGMRWLGDGRLQINTADYLPRDISGAELIFVPVTASRGWVSWEGPRRYALIYPCSGVLVSPVTAPRALGRLLGPARARVLVLLEAPKSTTQLVALTGQPLGSVGRHLKVLLEAGLAGRRRAGRSVLYYRTTLGDDLVSTGSY
jgi:DNA-binding transcriptional ArsR family regulator